MFYMQFGELVIVNFNEFLSQFAELNVVIFNNLMSVRQTDPRINVNPKSFCQLNFWQLCILSAWRKMLHFCS